MRLSCTINDKKDTWQVNVNNHKKDAPDEFVF